MIKLNAEQLFNKLDNELPRLFGKGKVLSVFGQDNYWGITLENIGLKEATSNLLTYLDENDIELINGSTEFEDDGGVISLKFEHIWIDHELSDALNNFLKTGDC